jgi:hypothetical protein
VLAAERAMPLGGVDKKKAAPVSRLIPYSGGLGRQFLSVS